MSWLLDTLAGWPWWAGLALAGAVALLIVLIAVLLLRRRDGEGKPKQRRAKGDAADLATVVGGCRRFHRRLATAFPGRRGRYRLPLYAVVGPSREAIANTVRRSGLSRPLGEPVGGGGLTWTAFEAGATVEVDPAVIFGHERRDRWQHLIAALQRHRPERPLDGIVVVLPAGKLAGEGAEDADALRAEAETIRTRLGTIQNELGMTLPIHAVVAGGEAIEGFSALGDFLPANTLDQPLGYTLPWGESEGYSATHVDQAVAHLADRVDQLVTESLSAGTRTDTAERDAAFLLPNSVRALADPLRTYFDALFQGGQYARLAGLRGIYLSGAVREGPRGEVARRPSFAGGALRERVFAEYTLAEPAQAFLMSTNRDVRRAQVATAVLVLLAGTGLFAADRVLTHRVSQLDSLTRAIEQDYRRVSAARTRGNVDSSLISQDTLGFLRRAADLDGFFLRSLLVPSSWVAQLPRDLNRLQTGAYVELLFKSIRSSLEDRARRITSAGGGTRGLAEEGEGERPYPDTAALNQTLQRYQRLVDHLEHYETLREDPGDAYALRQLVAFLYDLELPEEFESEIDTAGQQEGLLLSPLPADRFVDQAQASFLQRFDTFTDDLIGRHTVLGRLRDAERVLRGNAVVPAERRVALTRLRELRDALGRVNELFADGTYDWVNTEGGKLGPRFGAVLDRAAQNPLLGERVAERMRQGVASARRSFRRELDGISVPDLGRLVARGEDAVRLTASAEAVLQRLRSFDLGPGSGPVAAGAFPGQLASAVGQGKQPEVPRSPGGERHIRWRVELLEAGRRVLERIDTDALGEGESAAVTRTLRAIVRAEKMDAVTAAVDQAAQPRPTRAGEGGADETGLRRRVRNFDTARRVLSDILFDLKDMGAFRLRREIAWLAGQEALSLLRRVSELRERGGVYPVDRAALDSWEGGRGLAQRLFDADSERQLAAYLSTQRSRLDKLASTFAGPARAFIANHADVYRPDDPTPVVRWQAIADALEQYRNDAPDSIIARLESYVTGRLRRVSRDRCELAQPATPVEGDTFFHDRLRRLSRAVLERCRDLKRQEIHDSYAQLARYFNDNLAGRSPFVKGGEPTRADATAPGAVAQFGDRFARAMNQGVGDPRYWPERPEIPRFLDRMDRVLAALSPAMRTDGETTSVRYQLDSTFRVNRENESGGDQIINWRLRSGDADRSLFDGDKTIAWETGEAVAISLDWAKNAPSKPVDADNGKPGYARQGRSVTFEARGRWALATFIARHRVSGDAKSGHLLRFDVPVAYTSEDSDAELQGGRARVFARLTLRANESVIEVPSFPAEAPAPPRSVSSAGQGEAGSDRAVVTWDGGDGDSTTAGAAGDPEPVGKPARKPEAQGSIPGGGDADTPGPQDGGAFVAAADWRAGAGPAAGEAFYIQAAAFRTRADARAMRDRLGGVGDAFVRAAEVDGERFHRVRLGPFDSRPAVDAALRALGEAGVSRPGVIVTRRGGG